MRIIPVILFFLCHVLNAGAQFRTANLQAAGTTCALCSNAIQKALQKLPFIESVKADTKHPSFDMVFRNEPVPDPDAIRSAVETAGFDVGKLTLTGRFTDLAVTPGQAVPFGGSYFHFFMKERTVLSGEHTLTIVDKGFETQKEYKNKATGDRLNCMQYGRAGHCPAAAGLSSETRIYHVSL